MKGCDFFISFAAWEERRKDFVAFQFRPRLSLRPERANFNICQLNRESLREKRIHSLALPLASPETGGSIQLDIENSIEYSIEFSSTSGHHVKLNRNLNRIVFN